MPSEYDPEGSVEHDDDVHVPGPHRTMEYQLFESLIHHLIEKGVLTKNDALSVVQTVAEVKRGEQEEGLSPAATTHREIVALAKLYSSFELMQDGRSASERMGGENIVQLRPPLHGDEPEFPRDH